MFNILTLISGAFTSPTIVFCAPLLFMWEKNYVVLESPSFHQLLGHCTFFNHDPFFQLLPYLFFLLFIHYNLIKIPHYFLYPIQLVSQNS